MAQQPADFRPVAAAAGGGDTPTNSLI